METKISVFHGRTFAWKLRLKLSYFCSEKIAQSPSWFAHSSDWRNSHIPSKCYCRVFPCNLIDMCVVQGHSSLHCKLLIQVSCLLDKCIVTMYSLSPDLVCSRNVQENWCWGAFRGGLQKIAASFLHELPQIASQTEDWGCIQTGFPGAIFLLHVVPRIVLQIEDWGVFKGGLLDAASLLHELVRFHLLPTFKHWRVFNLTAYKCHLGKKVTIRHLVTFNMRYMTSQLVNSNDMCTQYGQKIRVVTPINLFLIHSVYHNVPDFGKD
jgi:hypothetical protein